MESVNQEVCAQRGKVYDERFARDKERLDKLDNKQDRIETLTVQMGEILKNQNKAIDNHDARITTLEHRPGGMWDKIVSGIIAAVTGGLISALIALILK